MDFFIGDWEVEIFNPDGTKIGHARTHAYWILDETAIQDDWRSLDRSGQVIFRGSSIRSYVPTTGKWVIHWIMSQQPGYTYIDAELKDGDFLGRGRGFDQQGEFVERFRYSDITETSYSFELERSYDEGQSWQLMSRSKAKKVRGGKK